MIARFTIDGQPMGKQRPRATIIAGHTSIYTPRETVNYESYVKLCYKRDCQGVYFGSDPLCIEINTYILIPQSFSKKKHKAAIEGLIVPTTKPDFDNIVKIVCDALNGVAFDDDKQITDAKFIKRYAEQPRLEISLIN